MALVLLVAFSRPGVSVSAVRGRSFCPSSDQQPSAKKGQDRGKFINYARQPFAAAQIQSVTFTLTLSACFLFYINLACKWWAFIAVHIYFMRILAHVFGPIWSVCLARSGSYLWLDLVRDFGLIWPMSLAWFGPCLWPDLAHMLLPNSARDFGLIWPLFLAWFDDLPPSSDSEYRRLVKAKSCEYFYSSKVVSVTTLRDEYRRHIAPFVDEFSKFGMHSNKFGAATKYSGIFQATCWIYTRREETFFKE